MDTVYEVGREIPVAGETDVLVIGGGLAGIAAAVSAARNGARALILEKSIALGGLATLGHVCIYLPIDDGLGHKIYGGMVEELMHVCHRYSYDDIPECWKNGAWTVENPTGRYECTFNIPAAVMAFDEYLKDEGVEVMFDTSVCVPIMEGNSCKGVIVENKSGRSAYLCKMLVDASGDADMLFRAGAECEERKSIVSSWTYELDVEKIREGSSVNVLDNLKLRWFGLRPDADNSGSTIPTFYGTTADDVNDFVKLSRSLALAYLKEHDREGYAYMTMPFMPQFRMTRRLKGIAEFRCTEGLHEPHSIGAVIPCLASPAPVYEFPYEGLIDAKIENMLAAGRMVSAGGVGWEIMRCIPNCVLTGQAAGTAAALALKDGVTVQSLSVETLQETMAATGIMIHMPEELRNNSSKKSFYPRSNISGNIATDSLSLNGSKSGH